MWKCDECDSSTPNDPRHVAHLRGLTARAERENAMREIRSRLDAMTDDEFRAFNQRITSTTHKGRMTE